MLCRGVVGGEEEVVVTGERLSGRRWRERLYDVVVVAVVRKEWGRGDRGVL